MLFLENIQESNIWRHEQGGSARCMFCGRFMNYCNVLPPSVKTRQQCEFMKWEKLVPFGTYACEMLCSNMPGLRQARKCFLIMMANRTASLYDHVKYSSINSICLSYFRKWNPHVDVRKKTAHRICLRENRAAHASVQIRSEYLINIPSYVRSNKFIALTTIKHLIFQHKAKLSPLQAWTGPWEIR